ncbi:V-type proton ATPase subunit a [Aphelenchoides fujianensis]|nr:V-type proton ATPase subunit a [Aphelenchoides fujianensis]
MGSLLRSELMSLCQIFLQPDSAFITVAQLGELGICQFRDLNSEVSSYNRKYMLEVKRCDEMQRQIKMVEDAVNELQLDIPFAPSSLPAPLPRDMNELEAKFEKLEEELTQIRTSTNELKRNYLQLTNLKQVLAKIQTLFDEGQRANARQSISDAQHGFGPIHANGTALAAPIEKDEKAESELKFIAGSIRKDRVTAFERVLWRMTHGNVYIRTIDIEPEENAPFKEDHKKAAFLLFFSGEQLRSKVRKICEGFRAHIGRLNDMGTVINKTLEHRDRVLHAAALNLRIWEIQVLKLKGVFHTLNKFNLDITAKCLIAECWVPTDDIGHVRGALEYSTELSGSNVSSVLNILHVHETPPTFHRVNKYTRAFQNIVDSYGIANYREINPAPWTITTFPFIFAVIRKIEAARIKDEIFNTFYGGRYVIFLMGAFAIYTGFVYNDFFSKSINIFGSSWKPPSDVVINVNNVVEGKADRTLRRKRGSGRRESLPPPQRGPTRSASTPCWNLADNKLNFMNPMKMKGSVIIGISQMLFGLMLSLFNYMQIVVKWIFFWVKPGIIFGQVYPGGHCAPSLLIGLIDMCGSVVFMMANRDARETVIMPDGHYHELTQCYLGLWYPGQSFVEKAFLGIAVLCIPVMLFVKPTYLWWKASRGEHVETHGHGGEGGEFNFGDTMVYQAIHTIEFALGCISHTASYLRLWALSLAHAQLSEVLWTMVLRMGLQMEGVFGIIATTVIFAAFGLLSVAILVLMEGLSAFLHALRLHWVEFQSKFYGGDGIPFEPFSFEQMIRLHEGADA